MRAQNQVHFVNSMMPTGQDSPSQDLGHVFECLLMSQSTLEHGRILKVTWALTKKLRPKIKVKQVVMALKTLMTVLLTLLFSSHIFNVATKRAAKRHVINNRKLWCKNNRQVCSTGSKFFGGCSKKLWVQSSTKKANWPWLPLCGFSKSSYESELLKVFAPNKSCLGLVISATSLAFRAMSQSILIDTRYYGR